MKKRARKLCPEGVRKDCLYCIKRRGKVWAVLDPKGETVDESRDRHEAMNMAEEYIASCGAARSGYGRQRKMKFNHSSGDIKWKKL